MTDPTPAEALKAERQPCPFCAGEAVYCCNLTRPTTPMHWILCRDCHACPGDRPTEVEAWALWNTRALPPPATDAGEVRTGEAGVDEEVAALRKALSNLTRACELADANEDLSEHVDGSLLDAANAALELQYPVIWTDEQVASLNAYQESRRRHPFTCGGNRSDDAHRQQAEEDGADMGVLIATKRGWICPVCDYRQFWAHDFMFAAIRGLAR